MSTENVELVQRIMEHFSRTGEPLVDAHDPKIEVFDHDVLDAGDYQGVEGLRAWLADWGDAWDDYSVEPERWIDAGDKVVFVFRLTARGKRAASR
jgi:hypothetical protein